MTWTPSADASNIIKGGRRRGAAASSSYAEQEGTDGEGEDDSSGDAAPASNAAKARAAVNNMVDEHLAKSKGKRRAVVEDDEEEVDAAAATPTKKLRRLRKNSDSSAAGPSSSTPPSEKKRKLELERDELLDDNDRYKSKGDYDVVKQHEEAVEADRVAMEDARALPPVAPWCKSAAFRGSGWTIREEQRFSAVLQVPEMQGLPVGDGCKETDAKWPAMPLRRLVPRLPSQ